jgi:non-ribosomal peptide synthetase component F
MTLLAVFQVLLSSWTGASDVCVGTDISGRHQYELEPLVGFFVNQLPLRGRVEAQFTFRELLRAARRTCIEAYTHQDLPFEQLIESLHLSGSSPFPLFEAKLVLQNFATGFEVRLRAMETLLLEPTHHKARMPLVLMVQTGSTGLQAAFIYRSDLFASHTMNCLRDQFLSIVDMSNRDPGITVGDLTEAFAGEVLRDRRLEQRSRVRAQNDRWQKML